MIEEEKMLKTTSDCSLKSKTDQGSSDGPTFQKRRRCGKCDYCTQTDCGSCVFCQDKVKFGGKGTLKQCCIRRKCKKLNPKNTVVSYNSELAMHNYYYLYYMQPDSKSKSYMYYTGIIITSNIIGTVRRR